MREIGFGVAVATILAVGIGVTTWFPGGDHSVVAAVAASQDVGVGSGRFHVHGRPAHRGMTAFAIGGRVDVVGRPPRRRCAVVTAVASTNDIGVRGLGHDNADPGGRAGMASFTVSRRLDVGGTLPGGGHAIVAAEAGPDDVDMVHIQRRPSAGHVTILAIRLDLDVGRALTRRDCAVVA